MGTRANAFEPRMGLHQHVCLIYDAEQPFAEAATFLRAGFERHERCLHMAKYQTFESAISTMRRAGINGDQHTALTDLVTVDSRDTFLRDGYFDPEAVIGFFVQQTHAAVAAGYAGLPIFGDTIGWPEAALGARG